MNIKLKKYRHFYCRKHQFYGLCHKCFLLNGKCDYQGVFDRESRSNFNPCPICAYKNSNKCNDCLS